MNEYDNAAVYDTGKSGRGGAVQSAKRQFADDNGVPYDEIVGTHIEHGYVAVMHYLDEDTIHIFGQDDTLYVSGDISDQYHLDHGRSELFLKVEPVGIVIRAYKNDNDFWELSGLDVPDDTHLSLYDGDIVPPHTDAFEVTGYGLSVKEVER